MQIKKSNPIIVCEQIVLCSITEQRETIGQVIANYFMWKINNRLDTLIVDPMEHLMCSGIEHFV